VALITGAMPGLDPPDNINDVSEKGWEAVLEEAEHADLLEGKRLAESVSAAGTTLVLTDVKGLNVDALLRIDEEVVKIVSVDEDAGELRVERGAFNTEAAAHEEGAQVFSGPIEPPTGPRTGEDGTPPCGQLAAAATPTTPAEPIAVEGEVAIEMGDNFFQLDGQQNPTLSVKAGETITVNLTNGGNAIHNMRTAGADNQYDSADDDVSDPDVVMSGQTATLEFTFDQPGTYDYRCDFHPADMKGQIIVE
jgi:plastocyanin